MQRRSHIWTSSPKGPSLFKMVCGRGKTLFGNYGHMGLKRRVAFRLVISALFKVFLMVWRCFSAYGVGMEYCTEYCGTPHDNSRLHSRRLQVYWTGSLPAVQNFYQLNIFGAYGNEKKTQNRWVGKNRTTFPWRGADWRLWMEVESCYTSRENRI